MYINIKMSVFHMGIENCLEVYLNSKKYAKQQISSTWRCFFFVLWRLKWPAAGQRSCMVFVPMPWEGWKEWRILSEWLLSGAECQGGCIFVLPLCAVSQCWLASFFSSPNNLLQWAPNSLIPYCWEFWQSQYKASCPQSERFPIDLWYLPSPISYFSFFF